MDLLYVCIGFVLLIFGGDWLLRASVAFSLRLNIPKVVIGMTIVSFATSAPELIVSVNAALENHADISMGNVIGSNIANLGFVLAITILLSAITIQKNFYKTDWPVMMIASVLLYVFIAFDGVLQRYEGAILFTLLVVFLIYLLKYQKNNIEENDEINEEDASIPLWKDLLFLAIGGFGLWAGSELLISGAVGLAHDFNVSERVIGITIVSIGTSIPELAASVIAILKKEKAISLGNLIGSNIFNILAVLGITSMITPIQITDKGLLSNDIYWMLGISVAVLPLALLPKRLNLSKVEGLLLLIAYVIFVVNMIM